MGPTVRDAGELLEQRQNETRQRHLDSLPSGTREWANKAWKNLEQCAPSKEMIIGFDAILDRFDKYVKKEDGAYFWQRIALFIEGRPDSVLLLAAGLGELKDRRDIDSFLVHAGSNPDFNLKADGVIHCLPEAKRLAEKLGMKRNPLASLNLAYGIAVLGIEETERLHTEQNITYFARYPEWILKEQGTLRDQEYKKGVPLLLLTYTQSIEGASFERVDGENILGRGHRILLMEMDNQQQLKEMMVVSSERYGLFSKWVYGAHGNVAGPGKGGMSFIGPGRKLGDGKLDETIFDFKDLEWFRSVRGCFIKNPLVIARTCFGGANNSSLLETMSIGLEATVQGTEREGGRLDYLVDKKGELIGAAIPEVLGPTQFVKGIRKKLPSLEDIEEASRRTRVIPKRVR